MQTRRHVRLVVAFALAASLPIQVAAPQSTTDTTRAVADSSAASRGRDALPSLPSQTPPLVISPGSHDDLKLFAGAMLVVVACAAVLLLFSVHWDGPH